ncbi:MAG: hypothetical protein KGH93_00825 [Patescibacteria group bacterium]|nr:hypothetical protein [Patescibacteria group bacterium]MDE1945723.1 hypothetical protein [Patescibacteria group bacterium]
MHKIESFGETAEFRGQNLEEAYARILGGKIVGGFGDKGKDIVFEDEPGIGVIQVKSSGQGAMKFLAECVDHKDFIPVVIGDPGQHPKDEIFQSIRNYGVFIGDVTDLASSHQKTLELFKTTRAAIAAGGPRLKEIQKALHLLSKKQKEAVAA